MSAKQIHIKPISRRQADAIIKRYHYSHKVVNNSQLHLGVYWEGRLEGALSFGPPMDRRKVIHLVRDSKWTSVIELNRMAFSDKLPRNSESRALAIAICLLRRHVPQVEWVLSFANGAQCGDGTIYRAAGFVLTGISEGSMWQLPPELARLNKGPIAHRVTIQCKSSRFSKYILGRTGGCNLTMKAYCQRFGGSILPGYQFRYIAFVRSQVRSRLTVPILPYSRIRALPHPGRVKKKADEASG